MRVLVTNDDGVHAPGIVALACAMREAMFDVIMVAPRGEMSGSSASMAAHNDEIHYARVAVDGWADPAYALDGAPSTPAMTHRAGAPSSA
jgi:5'-nucleotidase